ncbi:MAG: hypothetical protein JXQ90_07930 [Cyclobacteriaceae bacterium]
MTNQQEVIDNYLSGRMGHEERQSFEADLKSDPSLAQEVQWQEQIIEGIKDARKAQLKARLQGVEVAPNAWEGFIHSGLAKVSAGVLIVGTIGAGIYLMQPEETIEPVETMEQIVELETSLPPTETTEETEPTQLKEDLKVQHEPAQPVLIEPSNTDPDKKKKEVDRPAPTGTGGTFTPQISLPENDITATDAEFEPEVISAEEFENPSSIKSTPIKIEVKSNDGKELAYILFNGSLQLFGDFTEGTYEILEVNSKAGKDVFLYYDDQYFALTATKEKQPLKAVGEIKLVDKLEVLRENK